MKLLSFRGSRALFVGGGVAILASSAWAHVTFRPNQTLRAGSFGEVSMVVPTERSVDTVRVSLEVPEAFLKAGGRLSRVDFPVGWQVKFEKEDKPGETYAREMDQRAKRFAGTDKAGAPAKSPAALKEEEVSNEMRKKWIKKVTFEGGTIPPDGFKVFSLSFQLPEGAGEYRFPAVQTYADGVDVSWSELVQGAQHPAPTLALVATPQAFDYQKLAFPLSGLAFLVSAIALFFQRGKRTNA